MKQQIFFLLTLLLLAGCATQKLTMRLPPPGQTKGLKTPKINLPDPPDEDMKAASIVFAEYANSDEFYVFLKSEVDELDGGNETNVDTAIKKFRSCLATSGPIDLRWQKYSRHNEGIVIGGWRNNYLVQNPLKKLNFVERAGHWIHEISHACGFTHVENDIMVYPIIKRSWPYQVGNQFEAFLQRKSSTK